MLVLIDADADMYMVSSLVVTSQNIVLKYESSTSDICRADSQADKMLQTI